MEHAYNQIFTNLLLITKCHQQQKYKQKVLNLLMK